jgi:hypothetical protein
MSMRRLFRRVPLLALIASLSACGDGGSDAPQGQIASFEENGMAAVPETGNTAGDAGTVSVQAARSLGSGGSGALPFLAFGESGGAPNTLAFSLEETGEGLFLLSRFVDDTGSERSLRVAAGGWVDGLPRPVSFTWGSGCASLYVEGVRVDRTEYDAALLLPPGTPLTRAEEESVFVGDVTVFAVPLTETQVSRNDRPASHVELRVGDATVSGPGETATVCVSLRSGGRRVAGTQNDLVWDGRCATLRENACSVRAAGKDLSSSFPPGQAFTQRTFVLALDNVDAIADGDLYCCDFIVEEIDAERCCPVSIQNALASDPAGRALSVRPFGGEICPADRAASPCDG